MKWYNFGSLKTESFIFEHMKLNVDSLFHLIDFCVANVNIHPQGYSSDHISSNFGKRNNIMSYFINQCIIMIFDPSKGL